MCPMCKQLSAFLKMEMSVIRKHLDEHKYLRKLEDRNIAMESFVHDYGWLLRELYCSYICSEKEECSVAQVMRDHGDLLKDKKTNEV